MAPEPPQVHSDIPSLPALACADLTRNPRDGSPDRKGDQKDDPAESGRAADPARVVGKQILASQHLGKDNARDERPAADENHRHHRTNARTIRATIRSRSASEA